MGEAGERWKYNFRVVFRRPVDTRSLGECLEIEQRDLQFHFWVVICFEDRFYLFILKYS